MKTVELYARVRRAVLVEGMSRRAAAREFGLARKTVEQDVGVFRAAWLPAAEAGAAAEAGPVAGRDRRMAPSTMGLIGAIHCKYACVKILYLQRIANRYNTPRLSWAVETTTKPVAYRMTEATRKKSIEASDIGNSLVDYLPNS